ncbi:MAG: hypothetical protein MZV65_23445 [Chromatiales bacterium]|nr:hypothetical protein [Chromatiales bacterium]
MTYSPKDGAAPAAPAPQTTPSTSATFDSCRRESGNCPSIWREQLSLATLAKAINVHLSTLKGAIAGEKRLPDEKLRALYGHVKRVEQEHRDAQARRAQKADAHGTGTESETTAKRSRRGIKLKSADPGASVRPRQRDRGRRRRSPRGSPSWRPIRIFRPISNGWPNMSASRSRSSWRSSASRRPLEGAHLSRPDVPA